jgi:Phosphoserine phosphatase RsbU, N-terminal domain
LSDHPRKPIIRGQRPLRAHQPAGFARQYRAALVDYLLGTGEAGRERAYELGRLALASELGLLQLLSVHQNAVRLLESTRTQAASLRRLKAADQFLMETLSLFELTYRGYVDLVSEGRRRVHPFR